MKLRRRTLLAGFSLIVFVDVFFNGMAQFLVLRRETRQPPEPPREVLAVVSIEAALLEKPRKKAANANEAWQPAYKETLLVNSSPISIERVVPGETLEVDELKVSVTNLSGDYVDGFPIRGHRVWTVVVPLTENGATVEYRATDPSGGGFAAGVLPARLVMTAGRSDGAYAKAPDRSRELWPAMRLDQKTSTGGAIGVELTAQVPLDGAPRIGLTSHSAGGSP